MSGTTLSITREGSTGFVVTLQMETLRLREVKSLAQVHTARRWWSWDLNPGGLAPVLALSLPPVLLL